MVVVRESRAEEQKTMAPKNNRATLPINRIMLYVAGVLYMGYSAGFWSRPVYHFFDVAKWIENNTEEDSTEESGS